MKLSPRLLLRLAAAFLWVLSIGCLVKAIGIAATAEESLYNPHLTEADRAFIHQQSVVADRWSVFGWVLQAATAVVLGSGIEARRVVRKIFITLGVLIAADGIALLLVAVIVH
jgi:hypothetical protein